MADYVSPPITVDGVVFRLNNDVLEVLLTRRSREPFAGMWALPGTYVSRAENTQAALERALQVKGGIDPSDLSLTEQLYTFDTPAVKPPAGGHAVSVVYYALAKSDLADPSPTSEHPAFVPVDALPDLAYQHGDIVHYAVERLRSKVMYTNAVYALLRETFTLTQLQKAYEAILGRVLDKRNFRKKFLQLDLIQPTNEYFREGAHRPALLYRFVQQKLHTLSRSFD